MKQKFIVLSFSFLVATASFAAETTVLMCTTPGDALDSVELVKTGNDEGLIQIVYMSGTESTYRVNEGMAAFTSGETTTVVGTTSKTNSFGGGLTDAALFTLLPTQMEARLAADGLVYLLTCHR